MVLRLPKAWPDHRHGTTCEHLATLADVMPTLVAAAGGPPPAGDGLDLLALARGQTAPRPVLDSITGKVGGDWAELAITDGRWKYLYFPEGPAEQLFDLQTDPHELHNLAADRTVADHVRRLRDELTSRHVAIKSEWVCEGKLVTWPFKGESVADRRNKSWPGYHTEDYSKDVRH
jgi:arylsulfatase A-like enzyme